MSEHLHARQLSQEAKSSLTSGSSYWRTAHVDAAGVPAILMADGPHGLRVQGEEGDNLGIGKSLPATCFPPAVALGSTWDAELVQRVGEALGIEASLEGVGVLLGPGINIKRSPLCGRNFEYYSEDPIVSGVLGTAFVNGVQSAGVGASVKHFAVNNQEHDRMRVSSDIDPRPLREIYLRAFESVVKASQPWTIMCSYNRINGVYASEARWLLTDILRDEWGFDGVVVSDWGAVNDRVSSLAAGLDLEMPSTDGRTDAQIVRAIREGRLDENVLDLAASRVLDLTSKVQRGSGKPDGPLDGEAHHSLARQAASRGIVLLRNEHALLPLQRESKIAVVGEFAQTPRCQGAGSSLVIPTRVDDALGAIRALALGDVAYSPGFSIEPGATPEHTAALYEDAVRVAADADVTIAFLGLPEHLESEGYDREDIDLPADQLALLDGLLEANPNVVVVLSNGGVVAMPFADRVPAIVEAWLLGQAGGGATADVLFGLVNPSGKLTETIPRRLEDTPAHLDFPGEFSHVRYGEGLFVGYRWYDARRMDVAFPFGYGLSYTTFVHSDAVATVTAERDIAVTLAVTNSGARAGREIVQLYTSLPESEIQRPVRELKAFAPVDLDAGQTRTVTLMVRRNDLAYWDIRADGWVIEGGRYGFDVGASSRDIRAHLEVEIEGDGLRMPLDGDSSLGDVMSHPACDAGLRDMIMAAIDDEFSLSDAARSTANERAIQSVIDTYPIGRIESFAHPPFTEAEILDVLTTMNAVSMSDASRD